MKNLKTTILVLGLTFSALVTRSTTLPENGIALEAERVIKESVKFPAICYSHDQKVQVLFTTDQNGKVNFALAKTNNTSLKQEIEKQFYNMQLLKLAPDVVNSVTLNFKTIK